MADELWGVASGQRLAEHDVLARQEALGRIAIQPQRQRLLSAQAGTAELKLQQAQTMMDELQRNPGIFNPQQGGGPGGMPQSMSAPYFRMAEIAGRSGDVTTSRQLFAAGTQGMVREANAAHARSSMERDQLNMQLKRMGILEGILSGAKDQSSFDTGNALYFAQTGERSPYAGMTFSPEMVKPLTDSLISAKDRTHNQILQSEYDSRAQNRDSMISHRDFLENHLLTMEEIARNREQRLAKAGAGKPLAAPTPAETQAALALVKGQMFPNLQGAKDDPSYLQTLETINAGAKNVAAEAKAILRDNPALTWNQALQRALTESVKAGDWQTVAAGGLFRSRDKTTFQGAGKSADTPLPLPANKQQMVPGKFYQNSKGQVGQWTGSGISLVASDNVDEEDQLDDGADEDTEQ